MHFNMIKKMEFLMKASSFVFVIFSAENLASGWNVLVGGML